MSTTTSLVFVLIASLVPLHLYAQPSGGGKPAPAKIAEPSKEQRAKMAEMHTQAAQCLNSDKTFDECREQMMENCPMNRDEGCPMMGMHRKPHKGWTIAPGEKQKSK